MTDLRWNVTLYLDSFLNLYHASNILAGLEALRQAGFLNLTFEVPGNGRTSFSGSPLVLRLDVTDLQLRSTKALALDLYDRSDRFCLEQLRLCDWYCKRSFYTPHIQQLPSDLQHKVHPLGLNYACRSRASTPLRALGRDYALRLTRAAFRGPTNLVSELQQLQVRGFLQSPRVEQFEQPPVRTSATHILFQTRLWGNDSGQGGTSEEVNADRVAIVRALKRAFPSQFIGGVMPNPFSIRYYPDLVSCEGSGRRDYIAWSKLCRIGVYTHGLQHSHAFKFAEYLASSKCIVSDPLRNTLPNNLVEGTNFLQFRSVDECVTHCAALLRDSSFSYAMQAANWAYYQAEVRPEARLKRLFSRVLPTGPFAIPSPNAIREQSTCAPSV